MTQEVSAFWQRALQALGTSKNLVTMDADAAASRAYYVAFYAVSALFAFQGRTFTKHSALEAAVHRDLVKTGKWPVDRGKDYSYLIRLRSTGDYGGGIHVSQDEAIEAVAIAERILQAVSDVDPQEFSRVEDET